VSWGARALTFAAVAAALFLAWVLPAAAIAIVYPLIPVSPLAALGEAFKWLVLPLILAYLIHEPVHALAALLLGCRIKGLKIARVTYVDCKGARGLNAVGLAPSLFFTALMGVGLALRGYAGLFLHLTGAYGLLTCARDLKRNN
jgi:hypothetical protein